MNRVHCLLACVNLENALDALPAQFVVNQLPDGWMLSHSGFGEVFIVRLITDLELDTMPGWMWQLCLIMPHTCVPPLDFETIGVKAFRALRRRAITAEQAAGANQPAITGPWSIPRFCELFPLAAAEVPLLHDEEGHRQSPVVALGDEPRFCGAVDYRPSDADALADTVVDVAALYEAAWAEVNA